MKITLDSNANWDSSTLGTFDDSSSIADEIDADNDGVITQSEIEAYQKTNKDEKDYTVIEDAQAPKTYQELVDLMKKVEESYSGMEQEAGEISQENASFLSQCRSLSDSSDEQSLLKQSKANMSSIEQLSEDFNSTTSSVKKALEEAKKNGLSNFWFGSLILNSACQKLDEKSGDVKQHIDTVQTDIENTDKTLGNELPKDDSDGQKKNTKKA